MSDERKIRLQRKVAPALAWIGLAFLGAGNLMSVAPVNRYLMFAGAASFLSAFLTYLAIDEAGGTLLTTINPDAASEEGTSTPSDPVAPERSKRPKELATRVWNWLVSAYLTVVALYFAIVVGLIFLIAAISGAVALEFWPQELGGIKPKCAVLDLALDQLSPQLATLLIDPASPPGIGAKLGISRPLLVFSTSGPWLIKAADSNAPARWRSIRLSEQAVRSVEWTGPPTAPGGPLTIGVCEGATKP